ncbi:hypothetical protein DSO57_1020068 [Entomophthora muscae]|uniref:Uncharacterized protein n=1 Tax=Entomophthora muscae TaxID=34485 RepID=A0ACC2TS94_9FUNG|nr:hypothetical protein DSO57_1020068 [Entomophthora muscae]
MGDNQQQDRGIFSGLYNKVAGVKTESSQWDGSYANPQQNQGQPQGNYNQGQQQNSYSQPQGSYNQAQQQNNYNQPQGNYNQGQQHNSYDQGQTQGNYNQGQPQNNNNQGQPQGNYNAAPPAYANNNSHGAYNPSAGLAAPAGAIAQAPAVSSSNQSGGSIVVGAVVALKHNNSGRFLSSQGINYQSGSGQQQVTTNQWNVTETEKWQFVSGFNQPQINHGAPLNFNQIVRLRHIATGRYLHSHPNINSPISQYQEVSGYGNDNQSDENDNWMIEKFNYNGSNEGGTCDVSSAFKLKHCQTGAYLYSHDKTMQVSNATHAEVACYGNGNEENNKWRIQLS